MFLAYCSDRSPNSSGSDHNNLPDEVDSSAIITNHFVNDVQTLLYAIEIADDFDTITIVDRIECAEPISICNKNNILIHGDFAEICLPENEHSILVIDTCTNITIEGLNLYFTDNSSLSPAIIHLKSGKNITIRNNHLHKSGSFGIKADKNVDSLLIFENRINDCVQYGVSVCASNTVISNNTFYNNRDGVSDIYLCKEIKESCIVDTNFFFIANHDDYVLEVEEAIVSGLFTEKESMSPDGIEKTTGYFQNDILICLEYIYSEEHSEKWKMFFMNGKLLYIIQSTTDFYVEQEDNAIKSEDVNKYFYLNGVLVKWEKLDLQNNVIIVENSEYQRKSNELNITINALVGMIPQESQPPL